MYFCRNIESGEEVVVNTNKIEGAWAHAKLHFKQIFGTSLNNFQGHLCEILWRNHMSARGGDDIYSAFFQLLKEIYPIDTPPEYLYKNEQLFDTWRPINNPHQDTITGYISGHTESDVDSDVGESNAGSLNDISVRDRTDDYEGSVMNLFDHETVATSVRHVSFKDTETVVGTREGPPKISTPKAASSASSIVSDINIRSMLPLLSPIHSPRSHECGDLATNEQYVMKRTTRRLNAMAKSQSVAIEGSPKWVKLGSQQHEGLWGYIGDHAPSRPRPKSIAPAALGKCPIPKIAEERVLEPIPSSSGITKPSGRNKGHKSHGKVGSKTVDIDNASIPSVGQKGKAIRQTDHTCCPAGFVPVVANLDSDSSELSDTRPTSNVVAEDCDVGKTRNRARRKNALSLRKKKKK